jgi:CubicO group peptidase (beta-lactamase class C family)
MHHLTARLHRRPPAITTAIARTMATLMVAMIATTTSCATVAAAEQPQTPATHQLQRWLDTFNAGDRAAWQRFISESFPSKPVQTIDGELGFRTQTGGLELVRFETATATRAVALVRERNSESVGARLTVEIEAGATHRIMNTGLQPGVHLPSHAQRLSDAELPAVLRTELERRAASDRFSGAVLVAHEERPVFSGAYGLADRARGAPNQIDTRFHVGSMNKMITAVAVLSLVQAGKLGLDDPIGKYLTDYPNATLARQVTIHHLLTQTGGTGDVFGPDFAAHRLELRTHQDYVKLYGTRDLLFEPGSRWMYSNYGFILLGAVIERISHQSYDDYVSEHVFKPAGMTATGSEPADRAPASLAIGYMQPPGSSQWIPNAATLPYRGTAAGGGYSTVGDLLRFSNALLGHRLLNAQYTDLLLTGKVDAFDGKYAYGFIESVVDGARCVGHGGGAPGMNGDLLMFPDSGYTVVVLANMDPPAAQRVSEFITNRLRQ